MTGKVPVIFPGFKGFPGIVGTLVSCFVLAIVTIKVTTDVYKSNLSETFCTVNYYCICNAMIMTLIANTKEISQYNFSL